jgi:hypothetical protein
MLSAPGTVTHSRCAAHQGRRRRWASRRPVDRHEPRAIPQHTEKWRRIDVVITLAETEVEVIRRCTDHIPRCHGGSGDHACGREPSVCGRSAVGLGDDHVPHAGDHPAERHDALRCSDHPRARRRLVLQPAIARAVPTLRSAERIHHGRRDRRLVTRRCQQQQRRNGADHNATPGGSCCADPAGDSEGTAR